jgi:adenine deaminase
LLDDLETCAISMVLRNGRTVTSETFEHRSPPKPPSGNSMRLRPVDAKAFVVPANGSSGSVIGIIPGKIITEHLHASLPCHNGECHADPSNDLLKVCVLERHGRNGNIGRGFVKGFGLRHGALAASVGHDSHNVCVVGSDDRDMAHAVNRLIELGGGFVAVQGGAVRAELPLTFAGLMSLDSFEEVRHKLESIRTVVRDMGSTLPDPFLQLAFLQLPVIPHLKITDFGLVDVDRFALVES